MDILKFSMMRSKRCNFYLYTKSILTSKFQKQNRMTYGTKLFLGTDIPWPFIFLKQFYFFIANASAYLFQHPPTPQIYKASQRTDNMALIRYHLTYTCKSKVLEYLYSYIHSEALCRCCSQTYVRQNRSEEPR